MTERLTKKQREFLEGCNLTYEAPWTAKKPHEWGERRQMPYYWGPEQMEAWGFWSASEAERFADRLVSRGLLRRENHHFLWLTDVGRAAIGVAAIPVLSQDTTP